MDFQFPSAEYPFLNSQIKIKNSFSSLFLKVRLEKILTKSSNTIIKLFLRISLNKKFSPLAGSRCFALADGKGRVSGKGEIDYVLTHRRTCEVIKCNDCRKTEIFLFSFFVFFFRLECSEFFSFL